MELRFLSGLGQYLLCACVVTTWDKWVDLTGEENNHHQHDYFSYLPIGPITGSPVTQSKARCFNSAARFVNQSQTHPQWGSGVLQRHHGGDVTFLQVRKHVGTPALPCKPSANLFNSDCRQVLTNLQTAKKTHRLPTLSVVTDFTYIHDLPCSIFMINKVKRSLLDL